MYKEIEIQDRIAYFRFADTSLERYYVEKRYSESRNQYALNGLIAMLGIAALILATYLLGKSRLVMPAILGSVFITSGLFTLYFNLSIKRYGGISILFGQLNWLLSSITIIYLAYFVLKSIPILALLVVLVQMLILVITRLRTLLTLLPTLATTIFSQILISLAESNPIILFISSLSIWYGYVLLVIAARHQELTSRQLFLEREKSEKILLSTLPKPIVDEIKSSGNARPRRIESASIIFCDLVNFTVITKGIDAISIVAMLNEYFRNFDAIAEKHSLERLKTIGDGYMCAGGVPMENLTHPIDACMAALAMQKYVANRNETSRPLGCKVRIGINTGPVIAGIIGRNKYSYDIWGESVNVASRHEGSAAEGQINVSKHSYLLVKQFFRFRPRGKIEIKGGETMEMYELLDVGNNYLSEGNLNDLFRLHYSKVASGEAILGFDV